MRVQIVSAVCHLDVGSSYPLGVQAKKGSAVRRLKRYVSWVQYDVSQYVFYLPHEKNNQILDRPLVRNDSGVCSSGGSIVF